MKKALAILLLMCALASCAAETAPDWIADLGNSIGVKQMIIVAAARGTTKAKLYMAEKQRDKWNLKLTADAITGKNGLGKTIEGDKRPPWAYSASLWPSEQPTTRAA